MITNDPWEDWEIAKRKESERFYLILSVFTYLIIMGVVICYMF